MLQTQLPSGKSFSIGLSDVDGTLSQLNIWNYEIATSNIIAMSSGGFNVHGSLLSWSNVLEYVSNTSINWKSEIYLPGKILIIACLSKFQPFITSHAVESFVINLSFNVKRVCETLHEI